MYSLFQDSKYFVLAQNIHEFTKDPTKKKFIQLIKKNDYNTVTDILMFLLDPISNVEILGNLFNKGYILLDRHSNIIGSKNVISFNFNIYKIEGNNIVDLIDTEKSVKILNSIIVQNKNKMGGESSIDIMNLVIKNKNNYNDVFLNKKIVPILNKLSYDALIDLREYVANNIKEEYIIKKKLFNDSMCKKSLFDFSNNSKEEIIIKQQIVNEMTLAKFNFFNMFRELAIDDNLDIFEILFDSNNNLTIRQNVLQIIIESGHLDKFLKFIQNH